MIQRKLTSTVLVDALAALTMALLYIMLSQARRVKNSGKYDAVIKFWRRNNIATMEYQMSLESRWGLLRYEKNA